MRHTVHKAHQMECNSVIRGSNPALVCPTLKSGPCKTLPLRGVIHWAHSLEWEHIERRPRLLFRPGVAEEHRSGLQVAHDLPRVRVNRRARCDELASRDQTFDASATALSSDARS